MGEPRRWPSGPGRGRRRHVACHTECKGGGAEIRTQAVRLQAPLLLPLTTSNIPKSSWPPPGGPFYGTTAAVSTQGPLAGTNVRAVSAREPVG